MGKQLKSDGGSGPRFTEDGELVVDGPKFNDNGDLIIANGTNPAEKKNPATELLAGGGSSGLQKIDYKGQTYEYNPKTGEVYKGGQPVDSATQAYIDKNILGKVTTAPKDGEQPKPYTLGQVATESKKKVELNKGLKGAAQSYKDYEDANKNLRNAQMDLTAGLQGEKDVIQTDVLGKPVAIQGSLTQEKVNGLTENVNIAKAKKQAAKESLIKVAPAFKDRNIDIVSELQKDNTDVEETVIPQAVEKIKFVEDISDLEDTLKSNGQTLDDWSKYVDTEAPKEFLDDKQRALYDVVKTGDEAKIKAAQELYYKDIDDEIRGIDSQITQISVSGMPIAGTGVGGQQQIADLKKQKEDLLNKKQGFLQPADALKQVAEIDPSFGVVDQLFGKISTQQKVKMTLDNLYAQKIKEQARLGVGSDYAQRRQAGTGFSQITPTGQIDTQEKLRKIDQAIKVLAPVAFLNQTPDMGQSNWTRFGRGVWNTIAGDATGTSLPKKEDIADNITSLMSKAGTVDNISAAGQKALKETAPTLTDKAIDMASYITAIAPSYGAIGAAGQGAKIPQLLRMAFGNVGKYSPLLGRITPSLATMTTEGITSELTGRALGGNAKQDLTFLSKFGAQGVTELLNNSPFGKLVSKAISGIGIKEVPKFVTTLAKINSTGTGSLIEEGVEEGISMYQNSDSYEDFKNQIKQFVNSPSDLFLFAASSYALGGFTSGISPNVSNKFYQAADKAYSDLPPDEKTAFDNVVNDVKQGQEDAVMEVVLKTVDKVPNKVVDGLVIELKQGVDKLVNTIVGEDGYEVKIGDTVYQGNTIQDLQNDIDDAQGLLAIYKGEQDNRIQNGITIEETETPPTAQGDQADVVLAKPEAGLGVEGEKRRIQDRINKLQAAANQDVAEILEDSEPGELRRLKKQLADLNAAETANKAQAAPTFENVPVFTYTPQDVEKAKNEVFDNLSKLQVGSVIENSDGEIKVVTENSTSKKGNKLIGVVTFIRLEDGSLRQMGNPVFTSKSADGKINLDYNPHTTGRNAKGEQVTVTDQITDKTIDLSKENIFTEDENGNLVKTNAFSTIKPSPINAANAPETVQNAQENGQNVVTQTTPQGGVTEPTKAPVIKAQVVGTTNGFNTIIDGGLGKQQDPRFTGEVQQGKSIFKVNPNNNESSFLDISLPSYDNFGRNGGIQMRFELPNGVDANTVFEAVKKEAAKLGQLDAKDPDFKSKVQGLVDKGIAKIQGLATGGAGQTAQVKETVSEKQGGEPLKQIYTDTNEVGTTQYYTVNDNGDVESSIEISPVGSDIVIDNAKVSPTEKRKGLASSLVDKIIQDYKGKTNTYIDENGNEITEPYQIKLGTVVSNEGTGFAKSIQKKIDDFNAEQQQITKAPKGEAKAEPSVKAEAEKEATPPTEQELDDYYEALEQEKKNVNRGVQKDLGLKGGDTIPYKNAVIHAKIGSAVSPNDLGGSISKESFEEFGNPNHLIGNDKATKYLRKLLGVDEPLSKGINRKVTQKLDTLAAEISESNNIEVTPEDIVEYLLDRAKRPEAYLKAPNKKTKVAEAVADTNNKAADDIETLGRLGTFADDFNIDDPAIQGELAFLFDEGDLNNLKEYINHLNLPENAEQKRKVQKRLQGLRDVNNAIRGGEQVESPTGGKETTTTPTEAEIKKKEVASVVDKWAEKAKAALGSTSDPNIKASGLTADTVVDLIADLVKDLANLGIDAAAALKTAKAKLKELGVDEDLINEAEAKYTGKETKKQAIPTADIDNLLKGGNSKAKALNNIADTNIKEVAAIVSDTNGRFEKVMDILNGDTQRLTDLEEKLGFKKIC